MGRSRRARIGVGYGTGFGCGDERGSYKDIGSWVEHRDVRPPNVLWNPEIRNVVLVDFERSQETSRNRKRKHFHCLSDGTLINPGKCFDRSDPCC
jgi:hypothetical protein